MRPRRPVFTPIPSGVDEEFRNRLAEAIAASVSDRAYVKEGDEEWESVLNYNIIANDIIVFFIGRGWKPPQP